MPNLEDTQPTQRPKDEGGGGATVPTRAGDTAPQQPRRDGAGKRPPVRPSGKRKALPLGLQWLGLFGLGLLIILSASALLGWSGGRNQRAIQATAETGLYLHEQYALAVEEMGEGRYELARQRFEYIFSVDPNFQDVAVLWAQVTMILNATATATPPTPTITPTPTLDPRPSEEKFTSIQLAITSQDWDTAINTILALRNADPLYRFAEVDDMLYLALRFSGVKKILQEGNLEGGLYDFSLAEQYGPLDTEANGYRNWARLYLYGNAFWYAYPDVAAGYYGQVAGVAPNLRDSSGLTAFYRYWASLIQYADQLAAAQDWCAADGQYEIALNAAHDPDVQITARYAEEQCALLTPSLTPTPTITETMLVTFTPTETPTPTVTATGAATATATATPSPTATLTPAATTATTP